jgi:Holliday junction resolvase RusA-like endonuclease
MFAKKGRITFKTADYNKFQEEIRDQLMGVEWPFEDGPVSFEVTAGLSNRGADLDNIIKPLLDTYQTIYDGFNDNKVYHVELYKAIVPKGEEFLTVGISGYTGDIRKRETTASEVPGLEEDEVKGTK